MLYHIHDLCSGLKIIQDGEPCIIINNEFVKPGKGQAFSRVKFRTLISGKTLEKTFKSGDLIELADVVDIDSVYLYNDNEFWYFMNCENFDQIIVDIDIIGENIKWLIEQTNCIITLWNGRPIFVTLPNFVNLEVVDTNSEIKGNTVNNTSIKLVKIITGVCVKVPLFVQVGDIIKIDTRSGEYISRIR